jgi:hypothetical protein
MFLYVAFFFQPTAGNSAGLRTDETLIGSLPVVSVVPGNSRESFSGTAAGLVGIRDPRLDNPELFIGYFLFFVVNLGWCRDRFNLGAFGSYLLWRRIDIGNFYEANTIGGDKNSFDPDPAISDRFRVLFRFGK